MKNNVIIELINKGIIDLNNEGELKSFLALKDNDVKFLLNIKDKKIVELLKEYILLKIEKSNFDSIVNLESVEHTLYELSQIENQELIPDIINFLDKISYASIFWNAIEGKINLINSKIKLDLLNVVKSNISNFHTNLSKTISNILTTDDIKILNIYFRIITEQVLIDSHYYNDVVPAILEIKDYSILTSLSEFVCDESMLESNDFMYIFKKAINYKDSELLKYFISIAYNESLLTYSNYKRIMDIVYNVKSPRILDSIETIVYEDVLSYEKFEKVIRVLAYNKINPTILPDFESLVFNDTFINSESSISILNILCTIKNSILSDTFISVVTNENIMDNDKNIEIAKLASLIQNIYTLSFLRDLIDDDDLVYDDKLLTVLRKVVNNQERSYSESFLNIITDCDFLTSEAYIPCINILFKTYDESKIHLLSEFITSEDYDTNLDGIDDFLELAFNIEDSNLLLDFITLIKDEDIKYNDNLVQILKSAAKIDNSLLLKRYIELIKFMINTSTYTEDNESNTFLSFLPIRKTKNKTVNNFEYILNYASNIKNEKLFSYMSNIIVDGDISKTNYLQFILEKLLNINLDCISYFTEIILNPQIIQFENYEKIVDLLSKINDSERLKILQDISNINIDNYMFENLILIKNNKLLKDISLMLDYLHAASINFYDKEFIDFLNTFIENYNNESTTIIKNLIKSKNSVIKANKLALYNIIISKKEININNLRDKHISYENIEQIINELLGNSLMYEQVEFNNILHTGTREDIIAALMSMDEEKEVDTNTLVKKL